MANSYVTPSIFIITIFIIQTVNSQTFTTEISKKSLGLKQEKLSHFHFYFHDTLIGRHPTAYKVAAASITNGSSTLFGVVFIIDDPLTVGPEPSSKQVGRAQGMYASAALNEVALVMTLNYVFSEGKYNGSTLSILGRNSVFSGTREMPVVGGSGLLRYARGYALANTFSFDLTTGNAVVEYNVYVFHY